MIKGSTIRQKMLSIPLHKRKLSTDEDTIPPRKRKGFSTPSARRLWRTLLSWDFCPIHFYSIALPMLGDETKYCSFRSLAIYLQRHELAGWGWDTFERVIVESVPGIPSTCLPRTRVQALRVVVPSYASLYAEYFSAFERIVAEKSLRAWRIPRLMWDRFRNWSVLVRWFLFGNVPYWPWMMALHGVVTWLSLSQSTTVSRVTD